jgi:hypothetical protein
MPTPAPEHPEPVPSPADHQRGYVVFVPREREGVLPQYRPAADELTNVVEVFAAADEFEPATFCVRPLRDLGTVRFIVGPLRDDAGNMLAGVKVDHYVVEPTIEQIGLTDDRCQWRAKWLRPADQRVGAVGANIQVCLDLHVPARARPGVYRAPVTVEPRQGRKGEVTIELEVLPVDLSPPMPWGLFNYNWHEPDKNSDWILWQLGEMRRAGMSQCVISPIHYQNRPGIRKDGSVDFSIYDRCVAFYQRAGFEQPPVLGMEGVMFAIAEAMGKAGELKFDKDLEPGVKADEIPADVRTFAGKIVRRIYEHGLEARWPPIYVHFADEPSIGSPKMEKAKFMYGLAREAAPKLATADGVYTHDWWKPLEGLLDMNIAHYVHPCQSAEANRRWHDVARRQNCRLYGIEFIGPFDGFWQGRRLTLTAEKGNLAGMLCWIQSLAGRLDESQFDAYYNLRSTWKGGPWVMSAAGGRVWRSFPWLGVREGIDDSRYLRTARAAIDRARQSLRPENRALADAAERRVDALMRRVAWANQGAGDDGKPWDNCAANSVRRELARIAIQLRGPLTREE